LPIVLAFGPQREHPPNLKAQVRALFHTDFFGAK